jgi:hypothetical protein
MDPFGYPTPTVESLDVTQITDSDVVMGVVGATNYPGTQRFRCLIRQSQDAFEQCITACDKTALAMKIVEELATQKAPAKFVEKVTGSKRYVVLTRECVVEKTELALRRLFYANKRKRKENKQREEAHTGTMKFVRLKPTDVLMGRGAKSNVHPGNRYFRHVIQQYREAYANTLWGRPNTIAKAVIDHLEHEKPPVRFLEETKFTGSQRYVVVDKSHAIKKAATVLNGAPYKEKARPNAVRQDTLDNIETDARGTTSVVSGAKQDDEPLPVLSNEQNLYFPRPLAQGNFVETDENAIVRLLTPSPGSCHRLEQSPSEDVHDPFDGLEDGVLLV